MIIKYKFANNETKEIEVDKELYANIKNIERETNTSNKRHYRHSTLLRFEPVNENNIETDFIKKMEIERLNNALELLTIEQKDLIEEVFFNGRKLKDIAKEKNISYQAIQNRIEKILKKLRKSF